MSNRGSDEAPHLSVAVWTEQDYAVQGYIFATNHLAESAVALDVT